MHANHVGHTKTQVKPNVDKGVRVERSEQEHLGKRTTQWARAQREGVEKINHETVRPPGASPASEISGHGN